MSSLSNPIISYCLQLVKPEAWSLMLVAWALRPRAHTRPTVKLFTTRIRIRRPATNSLTPDPTGNDFPPVHWLLDQGSSGQFLPTRISLLKQDLTPDPIPSVIKKPPMRRLLDQGSRA